MDLSDDDKMPPQSGATRSLLIFIFSLLALAVAAVLGGGYFAASVGTVLFDLYRFPPTRVICNKFSQVQLRLQLFRVGFNPALKQLLPLS